MFLGSRESPDLSGSGFSVVRILGMLLVTRATERSSTTRESTASQALAARRRSDDAASFSTEIFWFYWPSPWPS